MDKIVLRKEIDISLLRQGLTVPITTTNIFGFFGGTYLNPGQSKPITIIFDGKPYIVQVRNTLFNEANREKHPRDAIQIRYTIQSDFAKALRAVFHSSWDYLSNEWENRKEAGNRKRVLLPDSMKEYLVIYSTPKENVFSAEPFLRNDIIDMQRLFSPYTEQQLEKVLDNENTDPSAGFQERLVLAKFRKLDRSISTKLKEIYEYRCQICGESIGQPYGVHVCESHHIDYFSKSWNNDMSNQLIVCPNHHRIIHSADPFFNRKKLQYEYKNGYVERLVLHKHFDLD